MALEVGTVAAVSGLTQAIYERVDGYLSPPLEEDPDALAAAREAWRQLSHAIADGVITHLRDHMEIVDVRTSGTIEIAAGTITSGADPDAGHTHGLTAAAGGLTAELLQVPGTGRVQ